MCVQLQRAVVAFLDKIEFFVVSQNTSNLNTKWHVLRKDKMSKGAISHWVADLAGHTL